MGIFHKNSQKRDSYVINLLEDINYIKRFAKFLNSHLFVSIFALFKKHRHVAI
jgi:hypothetical protein